MLRIRFAVIKLEVSSAYQCFAVQNSGECFNVFSKDIKSIAFRAVVPKVSYAEEIRDQFPGDMWIRLCNGDFEVWYR
jgi:hypothetical protein